jgi:EAL and modified HD-GYP domain-containing signal transduction protein
MAAATQWLPQEEAPDLPLDFCRFVARQPIVDRYRRTFGYELLFRTSWENRFCADGDMASRHIVDNAVSFGLESLVGNTIPFINCTQQTLLNRLPTLLPTNTALEILEDIEVTDDLLAACRELHAAGYPLALDDFDFSYNWEQLIPFATYIKIDFRSSTRQQRLALMRRLRLHRIRFVAEKLETQEEYSTALDEGFQLFQGYFFSCPQVLARPNLSTVVNRLRFLTELNAPTLNRDRIVRLLNEEPSISYRVLRIANTVAISAREPVKSIRSALSLIGDEHFLRIATLSLASEFSTRGSLEPIRCILQRARFCELLGSYLGLEASEMYLFGMLSVLHSALQLSPYELSTSLKLGRDFTEALEGIMNLHGTVLHLARTYERGHWDSVREASANLHLTETAVSNAALTAQSWAANILSAARH